MNTTEFNFKFFEQNTRSKSRLTKMWGEQVSIKAVLTETNTRGLKRKLFNPEGGKPKQEG